MDNFKVIYKILKLLEAAMDYDEFDRSQLIPEYFGISENRLDALLVMLQNEGYRDSSEKRTAATTTASIGAGLTVLMAVM